MEVVLNFALTFSLIAFIMLLFSQAGDIEEELQIVTESDTYRMICGCFVIISAGSWFIYFLCLIWS